MTQGQTHTAASPEVWTPLSRAFEALRLYGESHATTTHALRDVVLAASGRAGAAAWPPPEASRTALAEAFHERAVLGVCFQPDATAADVLALFTWLREAPLTREPATECQALARSVGGRVRPVPMEASRLIATDLPPESRLGWSALADALSRAAPRSDPSGDPSRPGGVPLEAASLAASLLNDDDPEGIERLLLLLDHAAARGEPDSQGPAPSRERLRRFAEALPPSLRASLLDAAIRNPDAAAHAHAWAPVDDLARALRTIDRADHPALEQTIMLLQRLAGLDDLTSAHAEQLREAAGDMSRACLLHGSTGVLLGSVMELLADRRDDRSTPDDYRATLSARAGANAVVLDLCSGSDLMDDTWQRGHVARIVARIAEDAAHAPLPTPGLLPAALARLPRLLAEGEHGALAAAARAARARLAEWPDDPTAHALLDRLASAGTLAALAAHAERDAEPPRAVLTELGLDRLCALAADCPADARALVSRALDTAAAAEPEALASMLRSPGPLAGALAWRAFDDRLALLSPALSHPDPSVRRSAYALLRADGRAGWPVALLRAALSDADAAIRCSGACVAAASGEPGAALLAEVLIAQPGLAPSLVRLLHGCGGQAAFAAIERSLGERGEAGAAARRALRRARRAHAMSGLPIIGPLLRAAPRRNAA